jgi:hypothetical protein
MQLGLELGVKEWELQMGHAQKHGGRIYPPQVYAYFSARFIELVADGKLTPESYRALDKDVAVIARTVKECQEVP